MTLALATRPMSPYEAQRITLDLILQHPKELGGYTVKLDNAKRRAGQCNHGLRVISLSKYLMAQRSYEDTHNTITHEIAHALVGPGHRHDAVWSRKHRELGGDGKRCFEHTDEKTPWVGRCPHGKEFGRYRAPKRLEGWRCKCPGSGAVVWSRR
ncbi:SprT-like domain-containing protein [Mycobacterium phage miche]|nr:SprT-like domain-containing protein [Mycobacterium phage miche]